MKFVIRANKFEYIDDGEFVFEFYSDSSQFLIALGREDLEAIKHVIEDHLRKTHGQVDKKR